MLEGLVVLIHAAIAACNPFRSHSIIFAIISDNARKANELRAIGLVLWTATES
jgi:hypothetical protein